MGGTTGGLPTAPVGPAAGEAEHVAQLSAFLGIRGRMTATYKPVLLRCLLDIGRHNDGRSPLPGGEWIEDDGELVRVNLHFVAARFAKYYWDMGESFDLRQSHHHDGSAIVDLIARHRAVAGGDHPPTVGDLVGERYRGMREDIVRIIKKDALPRLRKNTRRMYEMSPEDGNVIVLKSSIVPFFRRHRVIIQNALNHKLAAQLEICNGALPRVATTIERMPLAAGAARRRGAARR